MTCHTDFALISTDFVCWGCNFTWSTTMHMIFFCIFGSTSRNALKKYFWRLEVKLSLSFWDFCLDLLRSKKWIFLKHFQRLVHKIQKSFMCIVVLHVKLQTQWTKSVEMRAKSVWQVKIIYFFNVFFLFFNFWDIWQRWVYQKTKIGFLVYI